MKKKEYFDAEEYNNYSEYKAFDSVEYYKVDDNKDPNESFDTYEDLSEKDNSTDSTTNETVEEVEAPEIKTEDIIKKATENTVKNVVEHTAGIAATVSGVAVAAVSAVVVCSTMLSGNPSATITIIDTGYDYVSYELNVTDMSGKDIYYLEIVNNGFEYRIPITDVGTYSNLVTGLQSFYQYNIRLVGSNGEIGGETTYVSESFYTLRDTTPRGVFSFDAMNTGALKYSIYISDYEEMYDVYYFEVIEKNTRNIVWVSYDPNEDIMFNEYIDLQPGFNEGYLYDFLEHNIEYEINIYGGKDGQQDPVIIGSRSITAPFEMKRDYLSNVETSIDNAKLNFNAIYYDYNDDDVASYPIIDYTVTFYDENSSETVRVGQMSYDDTSFSVDIPANSKYYTVKISSNDEELYYITPQWIEMELTQFDLFSDSYSNQIYMAGEVRNSLTNKGILYIHDEISQAVSEDEWEEYSFDIVDGKFSLDAIPLAEAYKYKLEIDGKELTSGSKSRDSFPIGDWYNIPDFNDCKTTLKDENTYEIEFDVTYNKSDYNGDENLDNYGITLYIIIPGDEGNDWVNTNVYEYDITESDTLTAELEYNQGYAFYYEYYYNLLGNKIVCGNSGDLGGFSVSAPSARSSISYDLTGDTNITYYINEDNGLLVDSPDNYAKIIYDDGVTETMTAPSNDDYTHTLTRQDEMHFTVEIGYKCTIQTSDSSGAVEQEITVFRKYTKEYQLTQVSYTDMYYDDNYNMLMVLVEGHESQNFKYKIDGETTFESGYYMDSKLGLGSVQGENITITIWNVDDDDEALSKPVKITYTYTPDEGFMYYKSVSYTCNSTNPGEITPKYNDDGTVTLEFNLGFTTEDDNVYYVIELYDGEHTYFFKSTDTITIKIPESGYFGIIYHICVDYNGMRYDIASTVPSGTIDFNDSEGE